ncbi:MAG TPA: diaminopimelate epimerase [Tepidisphaeraceae bacterium]|nr:diaminopimelate epimerase [Tepidisphaeraceae bacterium]
MTFTKMHGIGNDYIYVNGFAETVANPARVAVQVSDRHTGIGGDGLVLILPSKKADVKMRMFNADGSEAEMCGNAVRCVAKYAFERGLARKNPIAVETGAGLLTLEMQIQGGKVQSVTVDMGEPILELPKIPVIESKVPRGGYLGRATFVSMGNPHAVMFVKKVAQIDVARLGPIFEHHAAFPRRINLHWVQVHSRREVTMRTWERGSGITLACGTGACAVCVAGVLTGRTDRKILAHLPGGDLKLQWRESDNHVHKTGPAAEVFSGQWNGH